MATHLLPQDVRDLLSRLAISDSEESKLTGVNKYRSSEDLSGLIARIKIECPGRANDLTRYGNDSEIRKELMYIYNIYIISYMTTKLLSY